MSKLHHTPPAWFSIAAAIRHSGLSRSLIHEHINDGSLLSSTVKRPGRNRGRRLVQCASLDRLILSGIGSKSCTGLKHVKSNSPSNEL